MNLELQINPKEEIEQFKKAKYPDDKLSLYWTVVTKYLPELNRLFKKYPRVACIGINFRYNTAFLGDTPQDVVGKAFNKYGKKIALEDRLLDYIATNPLGLPKSLHQDNKEGKNLVSFIKKLIRKADRIQNFPV